MSLDSEFLDYTRNSNHSVKCEKLMYNTAARRRRWSAKFLLYTPSTLSQLPPPSQPTTDIRSYRQCEFSKSLRTNALLGRVQSGCQTQFEREEKNPELPYYRIKDYVTTITQSPTDCTNSTQCKRMKRLCGH
ncbi:hypothetical protein BCR33DRAFT_26689 [Rhizoclosmatium globosum]|uniref:Uncharacterized protein n=1 Tax=Rhizoclosmatium globosum TaxID=329046 RepID=A0A1Y2AXJ2_9FUNG|nr:hypothetical protein BCR33DRAFT_26689 [Rhizoclosmatium globosum]|eukprot:ORY27288.1 hypothetical protein BCR33DRAFT_26689 [Rhizoclosmatium globosum]